jgi:hypothetical protein
MRNCQVCGQERDEVYMLFRDNLYFCNTICYQSYYTVKGISITSSGGGIASVPPTGSYKVVNMFVDPLTGKLTIEYDDTPT